MKIFLALAILFATVLILVTIPSENNSHNTSTDTKIQSCLDKNPQSPLTKNLSKCDLVGASLRGMDLENANLEGSDLSGSDLTKSNLKNANLKNSIMLGSNLREADLYRADLQFATLDGSNLRDADLQLVYSKNTKFENIQRSDKTKTDSCFEKDTMNKAFCKIILKLYK
ncbi:MAG: pentapeptide repeat-containing protein, partial [Candidatus Nitrosotenuis sp.]